MAELLLANLRLLGIAVFMFLVAGSTFAAKSYSDNGDGTVTDTKTGLIWMRCSMGQTWLNGTCTGTVANYTWDRANGLTGQVVFAGHSDWRLPNVRELTTLADRSRFSPAIDTSAFPNTPPSNYWSSSAYACLADGAWFVVFNYGDAYGDYRTLEYPVRLVRSSPTASLALNLARNPNQYTDNANGTVSDQLTGLMWQRCARGQTWSGSACGGLASTYSWDQASALKENFASYSDWRLPTIDELESLVDYEISNPTLQATLFPGTPTTDFWSSTANPGAYGNFWGVNFFFGDTHFSYVGSALPVRFVRSAVQPGTFALSVTTSGNGVVVGDGQSGISCGAACTGTYAAGTSVVLTAAPLAGSSFAGWSGDCTGTGACKVTLNTAKQVSARFKPVPYSIVATGVVAGLITDSVANVKSTITFNNDDIGKTGAVYVTAVLPISFLNSVAASSRALASLRANPAPLAIGSGGLILVQLTASGWLPVTNGQLIPYATGVMGEQLAAQTLLSGASKANLAGAQFCVGYGASASEMVSAGRMQLVATVPDTNAAGSASLSCLVTDSLVVQKGWNLVGNTRTASIFTDALYRDPSWVTSVWRWDVVQKRWQFYAPAMDAASLQSYANEKGYGVLGEIKPGDGYWVNAISSTSVMVQSGAAFDLSVASLITGWNLVATASPVTPAAFNTSLGTDLTSLWAWDGSTQSYYFYAPSLAAQGGNALADFLSARGYLDFTSGSKTLGPGVGFWVNKP
jgi:hypothetical protein